MWSSQRSQPDEKLQEERQEEEEMNKPAVSMLDYGLVVAILAMLLWCVYSIVQIRRLSLVAEYNEQHLCFLTDAMFGPVEQGRQGELCDMLREDIHETWQDWRKAGNE